jgi:hypothetical protein
VACNDHRVLSGLEWSACGIMLILLQPLNTP